MNLKFRIGDPNFRLPSFSGHEVGMVASPASTTDHLVTRLHHITQSHNTFTSSGGWEVASLLVGGAVVLTTLIKWVCGGLGVGVEAEGHPS